MDHRRLQSDAGTGVRARELGAIERVWAPCESTCDLLLYGATFSVVLPGLPHLPCILIHHRKALYKRHHRLLEHGTHPMAQMPHVLAEGRSAHESADQSYTG